MPRKAKAKCLKARMIRVVKDRIKHAIDLGTGEDWIDEFLDYFVEKYDDYPHEMEKVIDEALGMVVADRLWKRRNRGKKNLKR